MPTTIHVDCAIIGSGQGGALARMLAEHGRRVALIERGFTGGTCINRGCTPTKARVASARRAYEVRTAAKMGVYVDEVKVDLTEVVRRSNEIVTSFRQSNDNRLGHLEKGVYLRGNAKFLSPKSLKVDLNDGGTEVVEAEEIVIATGVRPTIPKIEGLDSVAYLDSTSILELTEIPEHLVVLGGGYIACEYGQMFARFGSKVTLVQRGSQVLPKEDTEVAEDLQGILAGEGIEIRLNSEAVRVEKAEAGIRVHCSSGTPLEGSHLLIAVGQTPNTEDLNLAAAGLEPNEKGYVQVDEFLQAGPGLYGLGDVTGGPAFTHISYDDARIICHRLTEGRLISTKDRMLPYVVFTDPQLGRVGMNEKQAKKAGIKYRVARLPVNYTARGIESGDDLGTHKILVTEDTGQILGCSLLSKEGGELMAVVQMAMMGRIPYTAMRDGIFAHPTMAESFNNIFLAMDREEQAKEEQAPGGRMEE